MIAKLWLPLVSALLAAGPAWAQVPALLPVPPRAVEPDRSELHVARTALFTRLSLLKQQGQTFNAACANVEKGSAAAAACRRRHAELEGARQRYVVAAEAFNARVKAVPRLTGTMECPPGRVSVRGRTSGTLLCLTEPPAGAPNFTVSARGFVGGTTWVFSTYAYNVPPAVSAKRAKEIRDEASRKMDGQLRSSGVPRERFLEKEHYDFIIGVAMSSNFGIDLAKRVVWDNLARGRATPLLQEDYNKLRHRAFERLDCHSNGAMVCLAALANGDAAAKHVRLLGPQITPAALKEWESLVKARRIRSLEIHYNNKDPIAAISYIGGFLLPSKSGTLTRRTADAIVKDVLFGQGLQGRIRADAPSAKVVRFTCGYTGALYYTMKCHASKVYDAHLNR